MPACHSAVAGLALRLQFAVVSLASVVVSDYAPMALIRPTPTCADLRRLTCYSPYGTHTFLICVAWRSQTGPSAASASFQSVARP